MCLYFKHSYQSFINGWLGSQDDLVQAQFELDQLGPGCVTYPEILVFKNNLTNDILILNSLIKKCDYKIKQVFFILSTKNLQLIENTYEPPPQLDRHGYTKDLESGPLSCTTPQQRLKLFSINFISNLNHSKTKLTQFF